MSVNTTAILQYDNVIINNDITIASGMSLVGLLASSPWIITHVNYFSSKFRLNQFLFSNKINLNLKSHWNWLTVITMF